MPHSAYWYDQNPGRNRGKGVLIIQNLGEFPLASFQEAGLGNLAQLSSL